LVSISLHPHFNCCSQEGIIPAWEDEANKNGGKWSIQLPKDKNRAYVDKMWLYTVGIQTVCFAGPVLNKDNQMLAAIGETFDPSPVVTDGTGSPPKSLITGVIVSTRPQFYRLSIWTRVAPSGSEDDALRERIEGVGRHFKMSVLGYTEGQKLGGPLATEVEFLSHKDSEKKGKTAKKLIV
jgi:translation initiation factor 4E